MEGIVIRNNNHLQRILAGEALRRRYRPVDITIRSDSISLYFMKGEVPTHLIDKVRIGGGRKLPPDLTIPIFGSMEEARENKTKIIWTFGTAGTRLIPGLEHVNETYNDRVKPRSPRRLSNR